VGRQASGFDQEQLRHQRVEHLQALAEGGAGLARDGPEDCGGAGEIAQHLGQPEARMAPELGYEVVGKERCCFHGRQYTPAPARSNPRAWIPLFLREKPWKWRLARGWAPRIERMRIHGIS
jgi:hypothetical protein